MEKSPSTHKEEAHTLAIDEPKTLSKKHLEMLKETAISLVRIKKASGSKNKFVMEVPKVNHDATEKKSGKDACDEEEI